MCCTDCERERVARYIKGSSWYARESCGGLAEAAGSKSRPDLNVACKARANATTYTSPRPTSIKFRRRIHPTMQDPSQGVAAPLVRKALRKCFRKPTNTRLAKPPSFDLRPPVPTRWTSRPQCRLQILARCSSNCQNSCAHVMDLCKRTQRWYYLARVAPSVQA